MSASSGILPSAELEAAFRDAQTTEGLRVLAAVLEGEQLVPGRTLQKEGTDAEDYGRLESLVEPAVPSFFLFRLDSGAWLLVTYVPDIAPVRQKMLYASSRISLTRTLGDSFFGDSLHAHSPAGLTTAAYRAHLAHTSSSAPLTEREQEIATLKAAEGIEARGTGPRGAAFSTSNEAARPMPWDPSAETALQEFAAQQEGAVQLILDVPRETVVLASVSETSQLNIPTDTPSYTFVQHGGSTVLVYCCPPSSPVKSRLLYSASVRSIQSRAAEWGVQAAKRLETSDPAEVTSHWLDEELGPSSSAATAAAPTAAHSSIAAHSTAFSRPKRPGARSAGKTINPDVALPAQTTEGESTSSLP